MAVPARSSLFLYAAAELASSVTQQLIERWQPRRQLWLAQHADKDRNILSQQQARQCLGNEFDLLVFDASQHFNADAFAIAIGTLCAGGVLIVWLPVTAHNDWLSRLNQQIQSFCQQTKSAFSWQPGDTLPEIAFLPYSEKTFTLTAEQHTAIAAIHHVASGQPHRPLLLTADRGRGKSTALGISAAQLLQSAPRQIWVTAPSFSAVATLFQHAAQTLGQDENDKKALFYQDASLRFIAPDRLLAEQPPADLLIVDEAAAMPQGILRQWLKCYDRIVFASTLQGYEGSGRGLSLRFQRFLQQHTPHWQQVELTQPVRWAKADPLEQFSISALLLDSPLTALTAPNQFDPTQLHLELVDSRILLADAALLSEIMGLLAQAHYRTRPSDVQALFTEADRQLYVARNTRNEIIGVIWLVSEGPLESELAEAVHRGERRPNGDLLPQALLTHAGIFAAAQYRYQRVMRIAVHPAYQQLGIGAWMLDQLKNHLPAITEILGCSFSATLELIQFWQRNGFTVVKLGLHADTVTAGHAVIMLKPLTATAQHLIQQAQQRFAWQWPVLFPCYFQQLQPRLVTQITAQLPMAENPLSAEDKRDIDSFAYGRRALEFSFVPLQQFICQHRSSEVFLALDADEQRLLIALFLQQQPVQTVISHFSLQGHKALLNTLRRLFRHLLIG